MTIIEAERSTKKIGGRAGGKPAIELKSIFKVFGPDENKGLELLKQGQSNKALNQLGYVAALNNINLSVSSGEIYVVMGLSGSGKSTLVRCINRLIEPTAGHVIIEGNDITHLKASDLRKIRMEKLAMVFQRFALFPHMTVIDNIAFGLRVQGQSKSARRERAADALHLVGLDGWAERKPKQLSGGMQQRVGLARALAIDSPILLMDEPFGSLDPLLREEMQLELLRLQNRLHKTIVFITHDLAEAITVGNQIAIVRAGEIVQEDDPSQIVLNPVDSYVEAFVRDVNVLKILTGKQAADHSLLVLRGEEKPTAKDTSPAIILDADDRPIKVLYSGQISNIEIGSIHINGHAAIAPLVIQSDTKIMPHLPIIAKNEQLVILVDRDGRYQGTVNGQSVVRAIVHAKRTMHSTEIQTE